MYYFNYKDELYHYGVKGMVWGRHKKKDDYKLKSLTGGSKDKNGHNVILTGRSKGARGVSAFPSGRSSEQTESRRKASGRRASRRAGSGKTGQSR